MNAMRHHLVVLAGLTTLALVAGLAPTLWVLVALVVTIGLNRSTSLLVAMDERTRIPHLTGILLAVTIASLVAVAGAAAWLFLAFGWLTGVAFVVLWLLFLVTKESNRAGALREAGLIHAELVRLVTARATRAITDDQLTARAQTLLDRRTPLLAHLDEAVAGVLVSACGLPDAQHRRLLELLAAHTGRTRPYPARSTLRDAIDAATARS